MDPIILLVAAVLLGIILLRVFFGVAKAFLKIAILIVIAIVIWRLFFVV